MKNKKIELLSPAGTLEKLKIAILYGADAVYIGGEKFSLRARANNFTLDDIKEACRFAKKHHAKIYVTMNILPHNNDLEGLKEYLLYLESVGVTGVIISSMVILDCINKNNIRLEIHMSTQLSISNSRTAEYYKELGAKRVVLAREVNLEQIKKIRNSTNVGIEVFIHGGMCSSYSGRCMLSNHMVNRDANRGGCAHSCRWNYNLYDNNDNKINENGFFNIGSKDLMALKEIGEMIEIGVDSLKVEGRMKSEYYIATVIKSYRNLIDDYYKYINMKKLNDKFNNIDYGFYEKEIKKAENRLTSTGFLKGNVTVNEQLYDRDDHPTKEFVGRIINYNFLSKIVTLEQRNYFKVGDILEFFGPNLDNVKYKVENIYDTDMNSIECARHPKQIIKLKVNFKCHKDDMIRIIQD